MKLAFSLVLPDDSDALPLLESIRLAGFEGVEPTFSVEGALPGSAGAARLRRMADQVGLKIPSMRGGPGFWQTFASADSAKRSVAVELAAKAMEALKVLGGDVLLVVPGQWNADQSYDSVWRWAIDSAKRIGEVAERLGVTVGLENVENRFLLSPREWTDFLDEVNSPRVRMYFDVGNVVYLGLGFPEQWMAQLGQKYITRIHFKDAMTRGALKDLREGEVNWPAVRAAMQRIEYDDWVGIELALPTRGREAMLAETYQAATEILGS